MEAGREARRRRIAMVSDFFYPKSGGIESHILNLSKALAKRGHRVIVITHSYGEMRGVKYVDKIKVYYLTTRLVPLGATFPSLLATLPIVSEILRREQVEIVHGHQSTSTLALEAIIHAKLMSLSTCLTDHSILRPGTSEGVFATPSLKFAVADADGLICVSYAAKENTSLRAGVPLEKIHVIPNAVIAEDFTPDYSRKSAGEVVIVVVSRLVFRKGVDLLLDVIPEACKMNEKIRFIIAGDGDMREQLEQMRDVNELEDKVQILGDVSCREVRDVLVKGDILLNTSLTEAFCIAIIEGAACGLHVISTDVGGVREVLPEEMATLVAPSKESVLEGIRAGIQKMGAHEKRDFHLQIREMYSWDKVARRTEMVYNAFRGERLPEKEALRRMLLARDPHFTIALKLALVYNYLLLLLLRFLRGRPAPGASSIGADKNIWE